MSTTITEVHARMILDCRGYPTVQVDVVAGGALGRADVPAGRSTGSSEAVELRDGGTAYRGQGVTRALANVNEVIAPAVVGRNAFAHESGIHQAGLLNFITYFGDVQSTDEVIGRIRVGTKAEAVPA